MFQVPLIGSIIENTSFNNNNDSVRIYVAHFILQYQSNPTGINGDVNVHSEYNHAIVIQTVFLFQLVRTTFPCGDTLTLHDTMVIVYFL